LEKNHDKVFFSTFTLVLGSLFAIFFICVVAARWVTPSHQLDAAAIARVDERTRPAAQVITDSAALLKLAGPAVARAPLTGAEVVAKVCGACHTSGLLNAPKVGDKAAWSVRAGVAGGVAGLVASAIKGKNLMPASGGDPSLSEAEIKSAIEILIGK
jgi:cytochrome c5